MDKEDFSIYKNRANLMIGKFPFVFEGRLDNIIPVLSMANLLDDHIVTISANSTSTKVVQYLYFSVKLWCALILCCCFGLGLGAGERAEVLGRCSVLPACARIGTCRVPINPLISVSKYYNISLVDEKECKIRRMCWQ